MSKTEFLPTVQDMFYPGEMLADLTARPAPPTLTRIAQHPSDIKLYTPINMAKYRDADEALGRYTFDGGAEYAEKPFGTIWVFREGDDVWHILRRHGHIGAAVRATPAGQGVYTTIYTDEEERSRTFVERVVLDRLLPRYRTVRSEPLVDTVVDSQVAWIKLATAHASGVKTSLWDKTQKLVLPAPTKEFLFNRVNAGASTQVLLSLRG